MGDSETVVDDAFGQLGWEIVRNKQAVARLAYHSVVESFEPDELVGVLRSLQYSFKIESSICTSGLSPSPVPGKRIVTLRRDVYWAGLRSKRYDGLPIYFPRFGKNTAGFSSNYGKMCFEGIIDHTTVSTVIAALQHPTLLVESLSDRRERYNPANELWLSSLPIGNRDLFDVAFETAAERRGWVFEPFDETTGTSLIADTEQENVTQDEAKIAQSFVGSSSKLVLNYLVGRLPPWGMAIGIGQWIAPVPYHQVLLDELLLQSIKKVAVIDERGKVFRRPN